MSSVVQGLLFVAVDRDFFGVYTLQDFFSVCTLQHCSHPFLSYMGTSGSRKRSFSVSPVLCSHPSSSLKGVLRCLLYTAFTRLPRRRALFGCLYTAFTLVSGRRAESGRVWYTAFTPLCRRWGFQDTEKGLLRCLYTAW